MVKYTVSEKAKNVRVSDFRTLIDSVFRTMNYDLKSCVDQKEKDLCIDILKKSTKELIETSCKRACKADWERRERAIEESVGLQSGKK